MIEGVIAVVTASGRAYYQITNELKKRGFSFLSLCPSDTIPLSVKVAITTDFEKDKIHCQNMIIYDEESDPSILVDKAIQIIRRKNEYEEVVVGVDPGKRFGIAMLGDGKVIKILTAKNMFETGINIKKALEMIKGKRKIIRIGDGVRECQLELITLLDNILPVNVLIESVEENGTTKLFEKPLGWRGESKDGLSAIKISTRKGNLIRRGNKKQKQRV